MPDTRFDRVVLIVLDSLGVGAMPDAAAYDDVGSNTLGHIRAACPGLHIPHLTELGLVETLVWPECAKRTVPLSHLPHPAVKCDKGTVLLAHTGAAHGRLPLASAGKDTITGHWEIAGLVSSEPFQTFERFPDAFIAAFEQAIGAKVLGNRAASGTEIIEELGPEHERSGRPIVYTSGDSVFQIAANTEVITLERLYEFCEIARALLVGPWLVGRVIARPYVVEQGQRRRTSDRRDYVLAPPAPTLLDQVSAAGMEVIGIGKIGDIFSGRGITHSLHTEDNADGCEQTLAVLREMQGVTRGHVTGGRFSWHRDTGTHRGTGGQVPCPPVPLCVPVSLCQENRPPVTCPLVTPCKGLIFTNLVDFDSRYGHRRDVAGYARALEEFDRFLPRLLAALGPRDLLVVTADHGNDPTHKGYNHTREYVPVLYHGEGIVPRDLGTGGSLADIGATIAVVLGLESLAHGVAVDL